MQLLRLRVFLALAFVACTQHPQLTQVSAATLAADMANEKCFREFGERPFKSEDFGATLQDGRWQWGTENGGPIDGYLIEVSFAKDGSHSVVVLQGRNRD